MNSYDVQECGCPLKHYVRDTPTPTGSEVLLRVLAAGVCHSDVHFWEGVYDLGGGKQLKLADRGLKLPLTMGHENVGEVVAFGPDVKDVKVGDRRLVYPWIGCGKCGVCLRGEENLCLTPGFIGVHRPGGYSDHLIVPHSKYLFDCGALSAENAAPLACSGLTTYSAIKKIGPLVKDEPILILGAGGLGLMCIALLKAMGGKGAIVADIDPVKREAALQAGAIAVVDPLEAGAAQKVIAAAKGSLWGAIDLVDAPSSSQLGLDCLVKGGKLVIVGLYGGEITLSLLLIPMRAITLQGSYVGTPGELKELIDLVHKRRDAFVPTTTRPLSEANAALNDLKAGKLIGRTVLIP